MAVGDIVSIMQAGASGTVYYQPALTIEIMITWVAYDDNGGYFGLYNGALDSINRLVASGTIPIGEYFQGWNNIKLGITNTNYFLQNISSVSSVSSFSGIQIK